MLSSGIASQRQGGREFKMSLNTLQNSVLMQVCNGFWPLHRYKFPFPTAYSQCTGKLIYMCCERHADTTVIFSMISSTRSWKCKSIPCWRWPPFFFFLLSLFAWTHHRFMDVTLRVDNSVIGFLHNMLFSTSFLIDCTLDSSQRWDCHWYFQKYWWNGWKYVKTIQWLTLELILFAIDHRIGQHSDLNWECLIIAISVPEFQLRMQNWI